LKRRMKVQQQEVCEREGAGEEHDLVWRVLESARIN
jgi:hypothetical protein